MGPKGLPSGWHPVLFLTRQEVAREATEQVFCIDLGPY